MAKRRYTDDDRAAALAALAANAGNIAATAKQLGLSAETLRSWATGRRHPEAAQMSEGKKGPLADGIEAVVWKMVDAAPDKIAAAELKDLFTAIGIAVDKIRLLRDQPTSIAGQRAVDLSKLSAEELKLYEQLARRLTAPAGAGGADQPGTVPARTGPA